MHIFTMLFLLSILVLVHELGHFGAARALGIRVEKFGFGLPFGPTLYETIWGKTKIIVHAFLLGGYVSFPDDDPDSEIPKDDPGRILNRKPWERFVVISAGVTANFVTAFLIFLFIGIFLGQLPSGKHNVFVAGLQPDKTYSSHDIGIKADDRIVSANGVKIDSFAKFVEISRRSKKFDNYVSYSKVNEQIQVLGAANPEIIEKYGKNAIIPEGVNIALPASTAEDAITIPEDSLAGVGRFTPEGQKLTDKQIELRNNLENKQQYISDGQTTLYDIALATGDSVHPVNITVERDSKIVELPPAYPNAQGIIGLQIRPEEVPIKVTGPISAVTGAWDSLYRNTVYMIKGLGMIFTGQIPLRELNGIIKITEVGSNIIQERGIVSGLILTALISINLAIVNLLPIPALDGGHLMFLLIEKLRGKPVDEEVQEKFARVGFTLLIGLMILIMFNDIYSIVVEKL